MEWFAQFGRRLQQLFRRKQWENDLAEEMRLHVDLRSAERSAHGVSPLDAGAEARKRFGNATILREQSRGAWGWTTVETFWQDLRYSVRTLASNKGFTAAAILSLTLGVGANTAIFTIINAVMLRSLPVEDPHRLVEIRTASDARTYAYFTNPIWEALRDSQSAFSGVFAYSTNRFDLSRGGESHFANGLWVSGDFFRVLGVPALRGRLIGADDDIHGGGKSGPVAVISYAFWKNNFAGDPNILGKTVSLDRHNFEIIGVTPPWFRGLEADSVYDVAIPIGCEPLIHTDESALKHRSWWWLRIMGRLKADETLPQAQAKMASVAPEITRASVPTNWPAPMQAKFLKRTIALMPGATGFSFTGQAYRVALLTLMSVVGLVLLIACVNIANLLLTRATARMREMSIRLAIGASRARLVRQLLTESLLLALCGAACGTLFSLWASRFLVTLISTEGNRVELDLTPDLRVLGFTALVAIVTGLLFGLVPAIRATGIGPNQALKENARGAVHGGGRLTLGKVLASAQVALSLVLLIAAGLFVGTLRNYLSVNPGFNPHNVLLVTANLPADRVPVSARAGLFDRMRSNARAIPGVRAAASLRVIPLTHRIWNEDVRPEGYQSHKAEDTLTYLNRVSPGFFETMQIPLIMGRDFTERDNLAATKVVIVGETAARQFWGTANPIGKTMAIDGLRGKSITYQVIGIAKDTKYEELDEAPVKTAFFSSYQEEEPAPELDLMIRFDGALEPLAANLRSVIGAINPDASLHFRTFDAQIGDLLLQPRLVALLSSFFGILALLLAAIGLYGVIAYGAARRRGEIGIRMALGAARGAVTWLVLRDVILMLAAGTVAGIGAALAAGKLVKSLLFGIAPTSPQNLVLAAAVLCTFALIAAYLPARRASRMDPMQALREE